MPSLSWRSPVVSWARVAMACVLRFPGPSHGPSQLPSSVRSVPARAPSHDPDAKNQATATPCYQPGDYKDSPAPCPERSFFSSSYFQPTQVSPPASSPPSPGITQHTCHYKSLASHR